MRMQNEDFSSKNLHINEALKKQKNLDSENSNFVKANFEKLSLTINEINFSVRTLNCLNNLDIKDIGELIQNSEKFLLRSQNFGRKSLFEIKNILNDLELKLDTSIEWPPENYKLRHKSSVNDKNYVNIIDPTTKEFSKIDVNSIDLSESYLLNIIKNSLKEREYLIIKKRYWENATLEEIGQEEKVTRERIRQIESKSIRKLRRFQKLFFKFLDIKKNEIFKKYSKTTNLVTKKSLSKIKVKYPLNENEGLINLSFDLIIESKFISKSLISKKELFFDKFFKSLDGGWYNKDNIIDLDESCEELIYYLDKKPLPRQVESARVISNLKKDNYKDVLFLTESRSNYYLIDNYLCENKNKFAFWSNKYLTRMHKILFENSPNKFISNNEVMKLINRDKLLNSCPYSSTITRAKDLLRGKGLIDTSHLFYVTGAGIIPLGFKNNNYLENYLDYDSENQNLISEEEKVTSDSLSRYLKIIEIILNEERAISINKLSEIYVRRIEKNIRPEQAKHLLGILLASYDKFKTIAPGVWSLKNTEHNSNNLVDFIVSNKESYSVDMYSLFKYAKEDLSNYVGYNAQFERDICIKGESFLNKNSYQSLLFISEPDTWNADKKIIAKYKKLKKFSNFYLNIKISGTYDLFEEKKIKSYEIKNLGLAILNIFEDKTVSTIGLNKFFDYSLFWNTSTHILVLLSYAGIINTPSNNLKPYKINHEKIFELRNLILNELIENGKLSWNRNFGKKIIKMIQTNYKNFIEKNNWITEDLKLHGKI